VVSLIHAVLAVRYSPKKLIKEVDIVRICFPM